MLSPYSISSALALPLAGAAGITRQEMSQVLGFTHLGEALDPLYQALQVQIQAASGSESLRIHLANSLWFQSGYPLLPAFLQRLAEYYNSHPHTVDFIAHTEQARQQINAWVEEQTAGKIVDLIQPGLLDSLTRLTLVNAVYFKGAWLHPFDPAATRPEPFCLTPQTQVQRDFMRQTAAFPYAQEDDVQLLDLPYAGDQFSLLVLLPAPGRPLEEVQHALPQRLGIWLRHLQPHRLDVFLPRFRIESDFRLDQALRKLGMPSAFDPQRADFTGINGRDDTLYISAVIHKAFLEVNEQGTEAAAATAAVMALRSSPIQPPAILFRADRPFLVLLRHHPGGSLLFWGRVTDPLTGL